MIITYKLCIHVCLATVVPKILMSRPRMTFQINYYSLEITSHKDKQLFNYNVQKECIAKWKQKQFRSAFAQSWITYKLNFNQSIVLLCDLNQCCIWFIWN